MSGCLAFSGDKGRLVAALPVGAEFETWRMITNVPSCAEPAKWWSLDRPEWIDLADPLTPIVARPRYRPGVTYHVGMPHWRRDGALCYSDNRTLRFHPSSIAGSLPRASRGVLVETPATDAEMRSYGWRPMPGRSLPGWAALQWAKCLGAFVQKLGDATEEQARAELVERWDRSGEGLPAQWRDYMALPGISPFACPTALASFFTLVDAVHHKPVPRDVWGVRYRFVIMAARPKEE